MSEVKKCIRSLAVCYLLLAVTIFPETGMIPKQFPTYRFSSVYLLLLSVCLILRYYLIVAGRKNVKHTMMHSVMNQADKFTLPLLVDYINIAQEKGAANVLAALLDCKNSKYPEADAMTEFVLDW